MTDRFWSGPARMNSRQASYCPILSPVSDGGGHAAGPGRPLPGAVQQHHRILGLPYDEVDPVTIIFAAQLRLRVLRRAEMVWARSHLRERIREVVAARESLLRLSLVRPALRRPIEGDGPRGGGVDGQGM